MPPHRLILILSTLLIGLNASRFEENWFDKIVAKFETYYRVFPQEKAYLHLDRPYYSAGEVVWFKAYLVNSINHAADSVSRVLYVDLVDKQTGKVVLLKKTELIGGLGQGELALGDSLQAGEYRVRAYTHWMRNFSEDFFFHRDIQVFTTTALPKSLPPNPDDIDVQFMPEGGDMVADLEGRVAFKAVNALGKGVDISGAVINQDNDTLTGFSSYHLGMGFFSFKPESGRQYRIEIRKPNGQFVAFPMPTIKKQGFVLTVDNLSNKENVRVIVRHNKPEGTAGEMALLVHTRGEVAYAAKAALTKKISLFNIPRANLGEGISHITLFDERGSPAAERLIFAKKTLPLLLQITSSKASYKPREKAELEITAKDAEGNPVMGSFSLSATDAKQVSEKEIATSHIRSYLLLTSDLKGTIEQPAYYFDLKNTNATSRLDILMMTQGWRRFDWKEVLKDSLTPPPYFLEQGISFAGKVTRMNKKQPGKVKLTYMITQKDSSRAVLSGESAETGEFLVYDLDIRDTANVLVQAVTERGNRNLNLTIHPFQPAPATFTKIPYNPLEFDASELAEYLKRSEEYLRIERQIRASREQQLKEVVIKAKKPDREKEDTRRMMYGTPDNTVKFDNMNTAGAQSIFDVIQGRVPGVIISGSGQNRTVQIRGAANFSGIVEPLFVLDGMTVSKDAIMNIPPTDVEAVDILKGASAAIYGSRGGGGVIAVLTKRGGSNYDWTKDAAEGTVVAKVLGYSPFRQFYTPKYDKPEADHVRPDFRPTLFWEPMVQTDKAGKARVTFFTSDAQTEVNIQVEGMTPVGALGTGTAKFKVE
ncbi:MAG: TonB-dependent receptor plug domain-containing protein [Spirosomataceae bacterium]